MVKKARHSEDDEEYIDEKDEEQQTSSSESNTLILPLKRNRSKSEGDIYCFKITQRSKNDDYFRKQSREKQIEILKKEDKITNKQNTHIQKNQPTINIKTPEEVRKILNKIHNKDNKDTQDSTTQEEVSSNPESTPSIPKRGRKPKYKSSISIK